MLNTKTPRRTLTTLGLAVAVLAAGCGPGEPEQLEGTALSAPPRLQGPDPAAAAPELSLIEETEAVLDQELRPKLRALGKSLRNLQFPTREARALFAETVDVIDLTKAKSAGELEHLEIASGSFELGAAAVVSREELSLWAPYLKDVVWLRNAGFRVVRGHFLDDDRKTISTDLKYEALARSSTGYLFAKAKLELVWVKLDSERASSANWVVTEWHTKKFETTAAPELLFQDVLPSALDPETYLDVSARSFEVEARVANIINNRKAGRTFDDLSQDLDDALLPFTGAELQEVMGELSSLEKRYVRLRYGQNVLNHGTLARELGVTTSKISELSREVEERLRDVRDVARPEFRERSAAKARIQSEVRSQIGAPRAASDAIAITDIDGDSFDDLFIARNGRNFMLRNRGDGTFEDITEEVALPQLGRSVNAALFVDVDNDDDLDLFLGLRDGIRYYLREDGRFVERTADLLEFYQPLGNVAMSAADYDGDGLIDIYVQTRSIFAVTQELLARANMGLDNGQLFGAYLPEVQARRFYEHAMSDEANASFNRPAPPNALLKNMGNGRFAVAPNCDNLEVYLSTHFAAWSDYDNDNDPDLYVSNDFGPNHLFRNDGGTFTDVTEETNTADIGFGMGLSWGDYDNDGDHDLYVTNMYSKAGLRITEQAGLDPKGRAHMAAHGNTLFRNDGDRFEKVSGTEPPALVVELGGWGWGSQFLDIDNDGFLDIYAPGGYISTPAGIEQLEDT